MSVAVQFLIFISEQKFSSRKQAQFLWWRKEETSFRLFEKTPFIF
jgi:hypothetical protein